MSVASVDSRPGTEHLYEGMFVLDSGKFSADHEATINEVIQILEKAGGTIVAHRVWQEGKLAYEIEGHRRATHFLVMFRMPSDRLTDVDRACRLNETVLRQMIIHQPQIIFDANVAVLTGEHDQANQAESTQGERGEGERGDRDRDRRERRPRD